MKQHSFLYIFPHPDDESFGPAAAMHKQIREGHEVHLLTLTRGGATKQRIPLGYSVERMGEVRHDEMQNMARVLALSSMTVLDLPDDGLKDMNPLTLETIITKHIHQIGPDIVVTYPVHGISGFHDHLVTHAIVKRVFCKLRSLGEEHPKRLAFTTLRLGPELEDFYFPLNGSTDEEIDCIITVEDSDLLAQREALACYKTYKKVIDETQIADKISINFYFEIFDENFDPPIIDLTHNLPSIF